MYLDIRKAFDSVSHNLLLNKLLNFGISGPVWNWFKCYLEGRSQLVQVGDCQSSIRPVLSGVPQGSILGPLLFLIFVNDMFSVVSHCSLLLFADDAKLYRQISNQEDSLLLQHDLNSVCAWADNNHLLFNHVKSVFVMFRKSSNNASWSPEYSISGNTLNSNLLQKDLGVLISYDLCWSQHLSKIVANAMRQLFLIRRSFRTSCIQAKKLLYISLIRSQLQYCSQLWRPRLIKDLQFIERVQRWSTKYILNDFKSDYRTRLQLLRLLPLSMQMEMSDILFFVRSVKSPSPGFDILEFTSFSKSSRSSTYNKLQWSNRNSWFYFDRLPRLWNALPTIDLTLSYETIKSQLHRFYFNYFLNNFNPDNYCSYYFACPCVKCSNFTRSNFLFMSDILCQS